MNCFSLSLARFFSFLLNGSKCGETYVKSWVDFEVGVEISLVVAPHGAGHAGPGLLDGKDTLDVVANELLSGDGVNDCGLNAEEWQGGTAGLGGRAASKWGDDVGTSLGLPVRLIRVSKLFWIRDQ